MKMKMKKVKKFKQCINYFDKLDSIEFKMRCRLNKQLSVLLILEEISEEQEFFTKSKLLYS